MIVGDEETPDIFITHVLNILVFQLLSLPLKPLEKLICLAGNVLTILVRQGLCLVEIFLLSFSVF